MSRGAVVAAVRLGDGQNDRLARPGVEAAAGSGFVEVEKPGRGTVAAAFAKKQESCALRLIPPIAPRSFASEIIASTLTPFGENEAVLLDAVRDQARRLVGIHGCVGIAVNTNTRNESLSGSESVSILFDKPEKLSFVASWYWQA